MKIYGQGHFGWDARDNTSGVYQLPGCRFMSWKLLLLHKFFSGFLTCCTYIICSGFGENDAEYGSDNGLGISHPPFLQFSNVSEVQI